MHGRPNLLWAAISLYLFWSCSRSRCPAMFATHFETIHSPWPTKPTFSPFDGPVQSRCSGAYIDVTQRAAGWYGIEPSARPAPWRQPPGRAAKQMSAIRQRRVLGEQIPIAGFQRTHGGAAEALDLLLRGGVQGSPERTITSRSGECD